LTFKTENGLRNIMAYCESGLISNAVVVGAGAIGVELAQALNTMGVETHLVDMAGTILSAMLDKEMVDEAEGALTQAGILLHLKQQSGGT